MEAKQGSSPPKTPVYLPEPPSFGASVPFIWPPPEHLHTLPPHDEPILAPPTEEFMQREQAIDSERCAADPSEREDWIVVYDALRPPPDRQEEWAELRGPIPLEAMPQWYVPDRQEDVTLTFESRFESGNLRSATKVGPFEYDLMLSLDINTDRHTQWFYFSMRNMRVGETYKLNICNLMKADSVYCYGMQPLVYSDQRAAKEGLGWHRDGSDVCYFKNGISKVKAKPLYTLTFSLLCREAQDTVYVAHCFPYRYTDLCQYLNRLEQDDKKKEFIRRRPLCKTLAGNVCDVLTITAPSSFTPALLSPTPPGSPRPGSPACVAVGASSVHSIIQQSPRTTQVAAAPAVTIANGNGNGSSSSHGGGGGGGGGGGRDNGLLDGSMGGKRQKMGVVVCARVHPGETNASWMMKGLIDLLVGDSPQGALLRNNFVWKIVPMLNPDGVIVGNYRCSLAGEDLNRQYLDPAKDIFPEVYYLKQSISNFKIGRELLMYVDLHGHSIKHNIFMYGCENDGGDKCYLKERIIPTLLSREASSFSLADCSFDLGGKGKDGCGRVVMRRQMDLLNSYTMEASFMGANQGPYKDLHFTQVHFEEMGRQLGEVALHFCDQTQSQVQQVYEEILKENPPQLAVRRAYTQQLSEVSVFFLGDDDEGEEGGSSRRGLREERNSAAKLEPASAAGQEGGLRIFTSLLHSGKLLAGLSGAVGSRRNGGKDKGGADGNDDDDDDDSDGDGDDDGDNVVDDDFDDDGAGDDDGEHAGGNGAASTGKTKVKTTMRRRGSKGKEIEKRKANHVRALANGIASKVVGRGTHKTLVEVAREWRPNRHSSSIQTTQSPKKVGKSRQSAPISVHRVAPAATAGAHSFARDTAVAPIQGALIQNAPVRGALLQNAPILLPSNENSNEEGGGKVDGDTAAVILPQQVPTKPASLPLSSAGGSPRASRTGGRGLALGPTCKGPAEEEGAGKTSAAVPESSSGDGADDEEEAEEDGNESYVDGDDDGEELAQVREAVASEEEDVDVDEEEDAGAVETPAAAASVPPIARARTHTAKRKTKKKALSKSDASTLGGASGKKTRFYSHTCHSPVRARRRSKDV